MIGEHGFRRGLLDPHLEHYFRHLFESSLGRDDNELEELIQPVISEEENSGLCGIPSKDEIKGALDQLGDLKVPGPYGMSALFFQHFWPIVEREFVEMVQHFFREGYLLKQLNHSFIVLIPKIDHPVKIE